MLPPPPPVHFHQASIDYFIIITIKKDLENSFPWTHTLIKAHLFTCNTQPQINLHLKRKKDVLSFLSSLEKLQLSILSLVVPPAYYTPETIPPHRRQMSRSPLFSLSRKISLSELHYQILLSMFPNLRNIHL